MRIDKEIDIDRANHNLGVYVRAAFSKDYPEKPYGAKAEKEKIIDVSAVLTDDDINKVFNSLANKQK